MQRRLVAMGITLLCAAVQGAELRTSLRQGGFRAETQLLAIECSRDLRLRVFSRQNGSWTTLSPEAGMPAAVSVDSGAGLAPFALSGSPSVRRGVKTAFGAADRISATGGDAGSRIGLALTFDFPRGYPDVVVIQTRLTGLERGKSTMIGEIRQAALQLQAPARASGKPDDALFWSLQGGGYRWGADYILPVRAGFTQDNDTGPKGKGNGGGFPFVDLWRKEMGVAVALLEPKVVLARVPVAVSAEGRAELAVVTRPGAMLAAGQVYSPPAVMICAHRLDFYDAMVRYRQLMGDLGVRPVSDYEPENFAPAWCTWGYVRTFTLKDVEDKIPQVVGMGMKELILDDGWQDLFGNWRPRRQKFPGGEADLRALIAKVHDASLKFRLWWSPGSADPGSDIDREHPDWFILDRQGQKEKASWNAYYLCPAYAPVREATRQLVQRMVSDWGVDSFKIDGTDLNHAPLCFNPAHRHQRPEESFEQWVDLFREIRTEARKLRPGFRVELCPCGITPTFQLVMTMDQPTDSDPYDEQVTSRTKFLKAMFGPRCPVLQEYVGLPGARSGRGKRIELYPRALGTGQVISTFARTLNQSHARWTAVYNRHRPSEGEYLNLYDLRWEPVEGHVIRKAQKFYYGFFTGKPGGAYSGSLELRGLDKQRRYRITDYANDRDLGAVTGPRASITATFEDALLLAAEPLER